MAITPFRKDKTEAPDEPASLSGMDRRIEGPRIPLSWIAGAAGALLILLITGYAVYKYGFTRTLTVGAERLTVSEVEYGTFREYIPVTGNVVPRETVYLDAVEGGQVTAIEVEEGANVEAGQPLLTLKNTDLQLQVIETEARVSEQANQLSLYQLQLEQARLQHKRDLLTTEFQIGDLGRKLARNEQLIASGAAKKAEVEDQRAELDYQKNLRLAIIDATKADERLLGGSIARLKQETEQLTKNLEITRGNLENLVVKAPISGQLTTFEAKVGESKSKGQRIGQIDELDAFKVSAFVDEFYLARVLVGQKATADVDGKTYEFTVTKVYPNVKDRQFEVDLAFNGETPKTVRRGQTLRLNIEIGAAAKSLILANGPYIDDTDGRWVFVVSRDNSVATRRPITVGRRNPDFVEVESGLEKGERVITSGYDQFLKFDEIDLKGDKH
jgi:HlyD family secretion protein